MHKARENRDGSFQIGRTWDLKELTKIERDPERDEGFMMVMGKKYYWETNTSKERTVFIKSLVKIFMQVAEGHVPELLHWDLSMFYLDEKSYERAVIRTIPTSSTIPSSMPLTPQSPQNLISPVITNDIPQRRVVAQSPVSSTHPYAATQGKIQLISTPQNAYPGSKPSLSKAPYSTTSTMNTVSNNFAQQSQQSARQTTKAQEQQPTQNVMQKQRYSQEYRQIEPQPRSPQRTHALSGHSYEQQQLGSPPKQGFSSPTKHPFISPSTEQTPEASNLYEKLPPNINRKDFESYGNSDEYSESSASTSRKTPVVQHQKTREATTPKTPQDKFFPGRRSEDESDEDISDQVHLSHVNTKQTSSSGATQNQPINPKQNLLEDLNAVLGEDPNVKPRSTNNESPEVAPLNMGEDGEQLENDAVDFYLDEYSDGGVDLNETIPEPIPLPEPSKTSYSRERENNLEEEESEDTREFDTTNDLSFENNDEARYSRQLEDPNQSHLYHQVGTIQEEDSTVNLEKEIGEKESSEVTKKNVDIDDDALLEVLSSINWDVNDDVDSLLKNIDLELAKTQHIFNNGILSLEKIGPSLEPSTDNVNKECDKMNPSFTLFLMEMNNFSEDIEYVESQDNGLQVEYANKKLLWNTLSELLNTVSLDEKTLKELLKCPIRERSLPWLDVQLNSLSKALKAISGDLNEEDYNLRDMAALKQRRQYYEKVTELFLERVVEEMGSKFANIHTDGTSNDQLTSILSRLLVFSSIILFCKEISSEPYKKIVEVWNSNIQHTYNSLWEKDIRKLTSDENELMRSNKTNNMDESSQQRILTSWKHFKETKKFNIDEPTSAKFLSSMITSLEILEQQCVEYQNFVENFFHISSTLDFNQFIVKYQDYNTRVIPLSSIEKMDPDRESAAIKNRMVSRIFQPIVIRIISFLNKTLKAERCAAPSLMILLEQKIKKLDLSNQEFLLDSLKRIFTQVKQIWLEYVDEQLIYLERSVINTSNRSICASVLTQPIFIKELYESICYVQNEIKLEDATTYESFDIMMSSCSKLAMTVTKFLTKKNDGTGIMTGLQNENLASEDLDESIELLMNSDWLIEMFTMLNVKMLGIFDIPIQNAKKVFDVEKEAYADFLLRESMPKLTSFVLGATKVVQSLPDNSGNPSRRAAYSKHNLEMILKTYTSSEIEVLVKRLHKHLTNHFSTGQNVVVKAALCEKLWSCLQGQTVSLYLKLYTLIDRHYKGTNINFTKNDVITAFEKFKK